MRVLEKHSKDKNYLNVHSFYIEISVARRMICTSFRFCMNSYDLILMKRLICRQNITIKVHTLT